jgi:hypothetical protein
MKKALVVLAVLVFSMSLMAQQRAGTIYGKIVDPERNPLPGVTVTLTGPAMAPMTTVTSDTGLYRFLSIPPGSQYTVKAELQGFKSSSQGNVIVQIGGNSQTDLILEVGMLEEQVTVTAKTPVVDTKKTATSMNVTKEEMQSLPTSRDPWVIMQLAPSIMVDRENVGGNESGQQSGYFNKGDMSNSGYIGSNNIWAIDGIDISDPAALGGSALYYDFDMFEELNITTGGAADVSIQTGGIALNMVTRRGGNKMSLAGRFYLTDNFFQSTNLTQALRDEGAIGTSKIQYIKDYGFNAGGPLWKDKVWWWGAYGVQDVFIYSIAGTKDQSILANYNLKINAQPLANNRFEALVTSGAKEKFGRSAGAVAAPEGYHQIGKYHWGSPIIKLQDEHVFSNNLYVSLKYSFNNAGFGWTPMTDEAMTSPVVTDQTTTKYIPYNSSSKISYDYYQVDRPRYNYQMNATYFNDSLFGFSHEIKIGAEYSDKAQAGTNSGTFSQHFRIRKNYNSTQIDADNNGTRTIPEMAGWNLVNWVRNPFNTWTAKQYAGYIQDTITKGNFTATLGLRFDKQVPGLAAGNRVAVPATLTPAWNTVFAEGVPALMDAILPASSWNAVKGEDNYRWNTWSPRIGLTWDIMGDGKTVAKLALSQYGDIMGVGQDTNSPLNTAGSANFWFKDANADGKVNINEIWWRYNSTTTLGVPYGIYRLFNDDGTYSAAANAALTGTLYTGYDAYKAGMFSGYDIFNPADTQYVQRYFYESKANQTSTRTREILFSLEREIFTDFAAMVSFSYRRYDNYQDYWDYYPSDVYTPEDYPDISGLIVNPASGPWYVEAGTVPDTISIGGTPYSTGGAAGRPFYLPSADYPTEGVNYWNVQKSSQYNTYAGVDFVLTKRLSNKWFMNASFTLQGNKNHWGDIYMDPTNKWMSDGKPYAGALGSASGKQNAYMYTRWMVKLSGLYQLPWGFNVSGTLNAREGWKIRQYFYIQELNPPNDAYEWSTSIYTRPIVSGSLPVFYNVSLRLEKKVNIGAGRLYFMADVFNLLNSAIINRRYDNYFGDYITTDGVQEPGTAGYWVNPTNNYIYEILNPRVWRFGVRFEF